MTPEEVQRVRDCLKDAKGDWLYDTEENAIVPVEIIEQLCDMASPNAESMRDKTR